jgi:chromosome partitioning protein
MLVLIANEKGGVGKTTLSVNLAVLTALAGYDTLLVDTDKQESASAWASVRHENAIKPLITCVSKTGKVGHDLAMLRSKFDRVIVDAGGRDSIEMRQAMAVCDLVLIPIKPAQFDVWSLSRMAQLISDVSERTGNKVNACAIINGASPNPAVRETLEVKEALRDYLERFPTLSTVITEGIAFRKAARDGLGVIELPHSLVDAKANLEMTHLYQEIFHVEWSSAKTHHPSA